MRLNKIIFLSNWTFNRVVFLAKPDRIHLLEQVLAKYDRYVRTECFFRLNFQFLSCYSNMLMLRLGLKTKKH